MGDQFSIKILSTLLDGPFDPIKNEANIQQASIKLNYSGIVFNFSSNLNKNHKNEPAFLVYHTYNIKSKCVLRKEGFEMLRNYFIHLENVRMKNLT